jgi:hypothetical protein
VTVDQIEAVTALLDQAEAAHGIYETTELNGVYDQDWAQWYAAYAVDHGLGEIAGHAIPTDTLAAFLATAFVDYQRTDPKPSGTWADVIARRIVAEL